jgi:hypothetical protein
MDLGLPVPTLGSNRYPLNLPTRSSGSNSLGTRAGHIGLGTS